MRARLATATALLLALPLCTAAGAARPKPTRCGMADPTGDVYVATPDAKVPGDHLDITCFDMAFAAHAYTAVIHVVDAHQDLRVDTVRFQLDFTVDRHLYRVWGQPGVFDEARNEYRITASRPTLPASWGRNLTKVRLTLFEAVDSSTQAARRDDAAWR